MTTEAPTDPVPAIRKAHARHEELGKLIKAAHTAYDLVLHAKPAGTHTFWANIAAAETALADLYGKRATLDPTSNSAGKNEDYYRALAKESTDKAEQDQPTAAPADAEVTP